MGTGDGDASTRACALRFRVLDAVRSVPTLPLRALSFGVRAALALLALALVVAVAAWFVGRRGADVAWGAVEREVERRYPDVATISTAALAQRLGAGNAPVLLDAREPDEYAVSHLPGAVRVDPGATASELAAALDTLGRNAPIVVYCSVGVRSGGVAAQLADAGFTDVRNLEGSIFRWANEGRPLVRDGSPTNVVHPYDPVWGRLLDADRRAPTE